MDIFLSDAYSGVFVVMTCVYHENFASPKKMDNTITKWTTITLKLVRPSVGTVARSKRLEKRPRDTQEFGPNAFRYPGAQRSFVGTVAQSKRLEKRLRDSQEFGPNGFRYPGAQHVSRQISSSILRFPGRRCNMLRQHVYCKGEGLGDPRLQEISISKVQRLLIVAWRIWVDSYEPPRCPC